ncbi:hypothetical protein BDV38DRAFT_59328 [Aspergillus pseudotamarii]|uniref:Uncharacterized protein n=1 Tax=Aspergillus pseudotamarii TaxID=132259 RepID=A0A5N6SY72_ASPPS|nr:uncharacterized protein BDV38DRAFT_59328 [Aspergillus pseudotamarii]KAE8138739.1 hypothetical protein BDV38DRAFT_59328 [Aspergillus pseudotamarii]
MSHNTPDLSSVLATLSALSQSSQGQAQTQVHPPPYTSNKNTQNGPEDDTDPYEPSETIIPLTPSPNIPHPKPQAQPQHQKPPAFHLPNTSTITTWPPALKSIMRTLSTNEDLQRKIRFLIQRQHDHERQWWTGREALVRKQKARVEKKKELDAVLRSVGAPVDEKEVSTAEEDHAELTNYDLKVYKASKQMADAMMGELRALQIPFFSIKPSLVLDSAGSTHLPGIGRDELAVLRRRMLELLQDFCKE